MGFVFGGARSFLPKNLPNNTPKQTNPLNPTSKSNLTKQQHIPPPSAAGLSMSLLLFFAGFKSALAFFAFMDLRGLSANGIGCAQRAAGMLSVRPHLAGTASGPGRRDHGRRWCGPCPALAGVLLTGKNGAYPLIMIMLIASLLGVAAIVYTIAAKRQVLR